MFVSVHSLSFSSNMYLWAKNDNVLVCLFLATGSLKYDQYHGFFGLSEASMLAAINRQWLCISMNLLCFSCLPFSNSCCCHQFLPSPASNLLSLSLTALTAERDPVIDKSLLRFSIIILFHWLHCHNQFYKFRVTFLKIKSAQLKIFSPVTCQFVWHILLREIQDIVEPCSISCHSFHANNRWWSSLRVKSTLK